MDKVKKIFVKNVFLKCRLSIGQNDNRLDVCVKDEYITSSTRMIIENKED